MPRIFVFVRTKCRSFAYQRTEPEPWRSFIGFWVRCWCVEKKSAHFTCAVEILPCVAYKVLNQNLKIALAGASDASAHTLW